MTRMFFWLMSMVLAITPVAADEKTRADDGGTTSSPAADKPAVPETVELLDGADSAEGALTAFVAASKAADDQAALLMVDPPIRRLLIPEIAIERLSMDAVVSERALFGVEKYPTGGIVFYCAQRELINIQSIEIINTSAVDADRIIFTILSTGPSYYVEGDVRIIQQLMAIRRSEKWYVFKPFGFMSLLFRLNDDTGGVRENTDAANRAVDILHVKRGTEEMPNRRNAHYELEFSVPFEKVHAELIRASESSDIAESIVLSDRLDRLRNSIVNRALRGEYKTRAAVNAGFQQCWRMADEIAEKQAAALQSALLNLGKVNSSESLNPANK